MATTTHERPAAPLRDLRRDPKAGLLAGVCAGLGRRLDIDPLLLRIVFALTTLASGVGAVAYVFAWIMLPTEGQATRAAATGDRERSDGGRRAAAEVTAGVGFLLLATLLAFRELGLPFSDLLIWPLVLVAAGGALIWRQSVGAPDARDAAAAAG
ncbi:MAG: PspC domain-containing protein, partial [Actinomycetota bacterium]|nr:PspC domain-containing protein [Actinomycetota bacterium]